MDRKRKIVIILLIIATIVILVTVIVLLVIFLSKDTSVISKICPNNCSNKGNCNTTTGVCSCNQGYSGNDCGTVVPICPGTPKCNGRGICNTNGTCSCNQGYSGNDCGTVVPICLGTPECNGKGTCNTNGVCVCNTGYSGVDCSSKSCPSTGGLTCFGKGLCNTTTGTCNCIPEYLGDACNFKIIYELNNQSVSNVNGISINQNGRIISSGMDNINIWTDNILSKTLTQSSISTKLSSNANKLLSVSPSYLVNVFTLPSGEIEFEYPNRLFLEFYKDNINMSGDGNYLAGRFIENNNSQNFQIYNYDDTNQIVSKLGKWRLQQSLPLDLNETGLTYLNRDGTVLVITFNSGLIQIWTRSATVWTKRQDIDTIKNLPNSEDRFIFSGAISSNGDIIAIGTPNINNYRGGVYVFKRSTNIWIQETILSDSDYLATNNNPGEQGISIGMNDQGTRIISGAPSYPIGGAIIIWDKNTSNWSKTSTIKSFFFSSNIYDLIGSNIVLSGDGKTIGVENPRSGLSSIIVIKDQI